VCNIATTEESCQRGVPPRSYPAVWRYPWVVRYNGFRDRIGSWTHILAYVWTAVARRSSGMRSSPLLPVRFDINFAYNHAARYLLSRWAALGLYAVGLTALTCWLQRRKDVS